MIKYLGSKRLLIPTILEGVRGAILELGGGRARGLGSRRAGVGLTVLDLFSGTSRVGHALKREGYRVVSNDHNAYAHTLARCYVQADAEDVLEDARLLVREFNAMDVPIGGGGYVTETFCERSRYFSPRNGERIDAIREAIARKGLEPELEAVMLVSLMEAADRVDSTTGVQMAYLKRYAARAANRLELRVPEVLPRATGGKGEAHKMEAIDAARVLGADVAYLDPPYNQHSYLGNYHVWESLVVWDKPEVYGVACKRADCVSRRSVFNSRPRALGALREVIRAIDARALVVSFSDEGFVSREDMEGMLREWAGKRGGGVVRTVAVPSKRYVGAKIGIHNQRGERVGKVSHVTNTEFVFTCVREASRLCVA